MRTFASSVAAARSATAVLVGAFVLFTAHDSHAKPTWLQAYGPRVGFSIDPDQLTIGGYVGTTEFSPNFRARPSIDLGFGNDFFTWLTNADVQYEFPTTSFPAVPFVGAGLGIGYYKNDIPEVTTAFGTVGGSASSTEIGLNLYGGLENDLGGSRTGSIELRLGLGDIPDFKVTAALGFL